MDLREYLKIFRRRKWVMVASFTIMVFIYAVALLRKPVTYTSTASLILQQQPFGEELLSKTFKNAFFAAKAIDLQTQLRFMQANTLRERVARKVSALPEARGRKISTGEIAQAALVHRDEQSPVIYVTVTTRDKGIAQAVANVYIDESVRANEEFAKSSYKKAILFLDKQLKRSELDVRDYRKKIEAFNRKYGVISFSSEVEQKFQRVNELASRIETANLDRLELEAQLQQMESTLRSVPAYRSVFKKVANPDFTEYRKQLLALELQRQSLSYAYTESHPKMREIDRKIADLKEQMATRVAKFIKVEEEAPNADFVTLTSRFMDAKLSLEGLQVRKKVLGMILAKERGNIGALAKEEQEYAELLERKETAQRVRDRVRSMKEELEIHKVTRGNARRLDSAAKPRVNQRVSSMAALLMLIVSFFLSVVLGAALEFIDDTIRSPFFVQRYLKLPIIGAVPFIKDAQDRLLLNLFPKSPLADPYHRVAFNLHQSALKAQARVLSFTSGKAKDGKTTSVINTGIALAWAGHEVLLVDGDFRHPSVHRPFDLSNSLGLSSLLSGELEAEKTIEGMQNGEAHAFSLEQQLDEMIKSTDISGLSVLPAGPPVANPIHLLQGSRFNQVLATLKKRELLILVDSPPLFIVTDGMVTASRVDGVCLVINSSNTKKGEAQYAQKQLLASGTPILGVILTMQDIQEELSYYYYRKKAAYAY